MSKEGKELNHILDLTEKDGKRFYHILEFSHEEIDDMLTRLNEGGVLTQEERDFLNKNKLTKFSTFSGSYIDLVDKPHIDVVARDEIIQYTEKEHNLINRTNALENITEMHDNEFNNVYEELDLKFDSERIKKDPKGGINFFFGTLLDEVINIGRPIDYDTLSKEDYEILSKNINSVESKAPEFEATLNSLFCNGTLTVIESSGQDFITVSWKDTKEHSMQIPADINVYAGGNGLENPSNYNATGLIIKSGSLKNVYGGSLGQGSVGFANILINGGTVLTLTGGGQSVYKTSSYKNHVGKSHIILNKGTIETIYAGSQGNGIVNQTVLNVNDGNVNWLIAGGEDGTTLLSEININGGNIKNSQGVNKGHVGCITYNLTGGQIDMFYAGGVPTASVDGTYNLCKLYVDGIKFKYNPQPGTNNKVEDTVHVSGFIAEYYINDLIINTNNIKKLNLKTIEHISREEFNNIESSYNELIAELNKKENKYQLSKVGHTHTAADIIGFVEDIQQMIKEKIESININQYALKEEVNRNFNSVNDAISSILINIEGLKTEDQRLIATVNNMSNKLTELETAVNYRTTNEDIEAILSTLTDITKTGK